MSRQNTSQTLMRMSFTLVLSLCSMSAFSEGHKYIEFLQDIGPDQDTFLVEEKWDPLTDCVKEVSPKSVKTVQGTRQRIEITYLQTDKGCGIKASSKMFVVQSIEHPEKMAYVWWIKEAGKDATAETSKEFDPYGLLRINDRDSDNIAVWVGNNN